MFDSPWSAAGTASGQFSFSHSPVGVWLREYRQQRADGSEFLAHEVYQQQSNGEIWLFGFDTFGFAPLEPARGRLDGNTLTLLKATPRGQARHCWTIADALDYRVDISVQDSAEFLPFLQASYRRETASPSAPPLS